MTTYEKITKKGYKIVNNIGYHDGVQCIVSVTAIKGNVSITELNITRLYNRIK